MKALIKPQYVDQIPKAVKGTVGQLLDRKDERNNQPEICKMLGRFFCYCKNVACQLFIAWFFFITTWSQIQYKLFGLNFRVGQNVSIPPYPFVSDLTSVHWTSSFSYFSFLDYPRQFSSPPHRVWIYYPWIFAKSDNDIVNLQTRDSTNALLASKYCVKKIKGVQGKIYKLKAWFNVK